MASKNINQRLQAIQAALNLRARELRTVVYYDDGGRLYFERDGKEVETTEDELQRLRQDPQYDTLVVCIQYEDHAAAV